MKIRNTDITGFEALTLTRDSRRGVPWHMNVQSLTSATTAAGRDAAKQSEYE